MISEIHSQLQTRIAHILTVNKEELGAIRTGRATPALLEGIKANVYGGTILTLRELASISTDGPINLLVSPFDESVIKDVEKAITTSPLGLSTRLEGKTLRVMVPALSTEQREKMNKLVSQKIEEAIEMGRKDRDDARKKVRALFEAKSISEDEKYAAEKEIDDKVKKLNIELEEVKMKKTREISEV